MSWLLFLRFLGTTTTKPKKSRTLGEQPKILHEESATSWRFFGQERVNRATWFGQNFEIGR